jgi:hypothetical protein
MTVLVRNLMPNMTREDYESSSPMVLEKVRQAPGFQMHVGFQAPSGGWAVSEIWDSLQQCEDNFEQNVKPNVPEEKFEGITREVIQDINLVTGGALVAH